MTGVDTGSGAVIEGAADGPATRHAAPAARSGPVWPVLIAISLCHMVNDVMQSLLSAIYPLLRDEFTLSYAQIGWMTFAFQVTASLLQPVVGMVTDKRPMPKSLALGMLSSFAGVLTLAQADSYAMLLTGAMRSASARPSSTPKAAGWPAPLRVGVSVPRNRYSSWAGMAGRRWDRCSRRSSWCPSGVRCWAGWP